MPLNKDRTTSKKKIKLLNKLILIKNYILFITKYLYIYYFINNISL